MCPIWPGHPLQVHWGFKDPSAAEGDKIAKRKAFDELINNLKPKIEKLIRLPVATMETINLKFKLREIYNNDK
jgi:arsenate reductase